MNNQQTLVITYVCTALAQCLIISRLVCRLTTRGEKLRPDDKWMAFATVPLFVRLATVHTALTNGSNNEWKGALLSAEQIALREIGAKVILVSRVNYAGFLWCMKACMLVFYSRITGDANGYGVAIQTSRYILLVTFIAIFLSTILECRPIEIYWEIVPEPPSCVAALGQLYTMGVTNILTDLMLIVLPLPFIFRSKLPLIRKLQIIFVFCIGFFVIAITLIRLPIIVEGKAGQRTRTLWASIECFVACFVANAPCMNVFLQKMIGKFKARRQGKDISGSEFDCGPKGCDAVICHDLKVPAPPAIYSPTYQMEESSIPSKPQSRKSSIVPGEEFVEEDGDFTKSLAPRFRQGSTQNETIHWNKTAWTIVSPTEQKQIIPPEKQFFPSTISPRVRQGSTPENKAAYLEGWKAAPTLESGSFGVQSHIYSPNSKTSTDGR